MRDLEARVLLGEAVELRLVLLALRLSRLAHVAKRLLARAVQLHRVQPEPAVLLQGRSVGRIDRREALV